jgi:hypothetical protein
MFEAFRAAQKPTHVKFADGREGMKFLLFRLFLLTLLLGLCCALGGRGLCEEFGGEACLVVSHVIPGHEAGWRTGTFHESAG